MDKQYNLLNELAKYEQFVDELEEIRAETKQRCLKSIDKAYNELRRKVKEDFDKKCEAYGAHLYGEKA